jgi:hypothetical protein
MDLDEGLDEAEDWEIRQYTEVSSIFPLNSICLKIEGVFLLRDFPDK